MKTSFKTISRAFILVFILAVSSKCSNGIEDDTNIVLIRYNEAISAYHKDIAMAKTIYSASNMSGLNMYQAVWNQKGKEYQLDTLMVWFYERHGEKAYNRLRIIVDDNFDKKMNQ